VRARFAIFVAAAACGRSQGVPDNELGGLVVAPEHAAETIDVARAAKDPDELGRALALGDRAIGKAIGPHAMTVETATEVDENGAKSSALDDKATIELGDDGAFHGEYGNSEDYGREVIFVAGKLYLRPRYQRWHARAPESPDEPTALRDGFTGAIAATWDLVAPAAELDDAGTAQVAGRAGRAIAVKQAPKPRANPSEPLAQRAWRQARTVDGLSGRVVLDADKGVPLAVELHATIGFTRDGRRFAMKVTLKAEVRSIGAKAIAAPPDGEVVATPERAREVDDRDVLLKDLAPPLKKKDGK
jgi:hypothetical protein